MKVELGEIYRRDSRQYWQRAVITLEHGDKIRRCKDNHERIVDVLHAGTYKADRPCLSDGRYEETDHFMFGEKKSPYSVWYVTNEDIYKALVKQATQLS
jgi:hypothetical protein